MRFTCPSCSSSYRLSRDRIGASGQAKIRCPSCKTLVRVKIGPDDKLHASVYEPSGAHAPVDVGAAAQKQPPAAARATQPRLAADSPQAPQAVAQDAKIWHVAIGREAKGPLTVAALQELVDAGTVGAANLVWRKGQDGWKKLAEVSALAGLLATPASGDTESEIKTTLKTGAAGVPDPDDEKTVLQDVVTDDMLARTGAGTDDDSPTVMADVVPPAQPSKKPLHANSASARRKSGHANADAAAIEAAEARTLKPARQRRKKDGSSGARLPSRATGGASAEASSNARGAQVAAQQSASTAEQPAKAQPAQPQPAKAQPAQAARAQPAKGKAAAGKPAPSAQSASFFETGEQLNQDFELQMPDPDKHKPTKEEYQNLLQEFSVMFRLDKRSKRQKWLITGVLVGLVVGVVTFGVMLYLQGEQRKTLLRDSKTILAVFALPYQQSADFDLTPEEEIAEGSAIRKKKTVSMLASNLLTKNKKRIVEARIVRKKTKSGAVRGGYIATRKVSKEEMEMAEARRKAAIAAALGGGHGGKVERVISAGIGSAKNVSKAKLRKTCSAKLPRLKGCAESLAGGAAFTAMLHVSDAGMIDKVTCKVGGKSNAKLSSCASDVFSRVNFGRQKTATTFTCAVSGS